MVLSERLTPSDFSVKMYSGAGWGNGWWVSGGSECRAALIRSPGEGSGALIWLGGDVEERVRFGWVWRWNPQDLLWIAVEVGERVK